MSGEDDSNRDHEGGCVLDLTGPERELLLRVCERYRATIPSYLKSREAERSEVDGLIRKLSEGRG